MYKFVRNDKTTFYCYKNHVTFRIWPAIEFSGVFFRRKKKTWKRARQILADYLSKFDVSTDDTFPL